MNLVINGTLVFGSRGGMRRYVIGDAALQVSPTDEQTIGDTLYQVLADSDVRRDLRSRGLSQARRFSSSDAAYRTMKVFATAQGGNCCGCSFSRPAPRPYGQGAVRDACCI